MGCLDIRYLLYTIKPMLIRCILRDPTSQYNIDDALRGTSTVSVEGQRTGKDCGANLPASTLLVSGDIWTMHSNALCPGCCIFNGKNKAHVTKGKFSNIGRPGTMYKDITFTRNTKHNHILLR